MLASAFAWSCNSASLKNPGASASGGTPEGEEEPGEEGTPSADGGRAPDPQAEPFVVSSAVTIQVQPTDNGFALLNAIRNAKSSVHMTIYLLTDEQIIDALGDLHDAGKDVKVVLNKTFPNDGGDNTQAYNALKARKVPVVWAPAAFQFTHAKMIVIDNAKVVIMTMNLTYSSPKTNREFIATDSDPQDVKDAELIFQGDYGNTSTSVNSKLILSPSNTSKVDARARLKALIDSATTSLLVETQSLSDTTLTDAIVAAHQAKIDTKVVLDANTLNTTGQQEALAKLKQANVPVRLVTTPDIHAKAIVVDGKRLFVGSQNFTPTALLNNREVGLVTDAATEVTKVQGVIDQDFAKGKAP